MIGDGSKITGVSRNRHFAIPKTQSSPDGSKGETFSVSEVADTVALNVQVQSAPTALESLESTATAGAPKTSQVVTAESPFLSFESGFVGASLTTEAQPNVTEGIQSGLEFDSDEVTRNTVGWAGEPTLTPPLGQSHRRLIAQGMAYMDKVAPGYRKRLDQLVNPDPDLQKKAHCQKLNDQQNQIFSQHGALLAHPEAYVKKAMPGKLEQHQSLNKKISTINDEWESTQNSIDSLKRKNIMTARDLSGDFLSKLRSQNAEGECQNASEAIVLGPGAQQALKDQGIEQSTLSNWVNEFHHQTGLPQPNKLELRHTGPRPQYWAEGDYVNMGDKFGKRWLLHEVAHRAEYRNPEVSLANKDWIRARAKAAGNSGTEGSPLKDVTGSEFYGKDEKALENHFVTPYVGKLYPDAATEVLSVGMEHFDEPGRVLNLYRRDPEHFFLVLGSLETLKGSEW